jgi:hypothetical protein
MLTVFVAAAALGSLFLFAGGEAQEEFLSPGDLSAHHHALQQKCTKCHTAAEGHAVLKTIGKQNAVAQSFKCLDCHRFGEHALHPHGVGPGQLSKSTHRISESGFQANPPDWMALTRWGPGIPKDADGKLACAVCHHEHRGMRHDLKQISERRCQVCHVKPFHAFSKDHPEFTNYPHKRRSRIHFDHSSHYGLHFAQFQRLMPDGRMPESCITCHTPDPSGAKMLVRGFEQSCASCHGREIQIENALPGVPLIKLPAFDEAVSQWQDPLVRQWPRTVKAGELTDDGGAIAQLPPFTLLLLSSDAEFRKAQRELDGVNLTRLQDASPSRKKAVAQYASAVRRLFRDLGEKGEPRLQQRLEGALGRPLDREMRAAVASPRSTGSLLVDAARTAGDRWFPPDRKRGKGQKDDEAGDRPNRTGRRRFGNWSVRDEDFTIRYRPRQHADPFLRFLLEASAANFARPPDADSTLPQQALRRMYTELVDPAVPGSCVKCHTVDRQGDGTLRINWTGYRPRPYTRGFTRFSHHPHLKELGTGSEACTTCHAREKTVKLFHPVFIRRDWLPNVDRSAVLTSGFSAIERRDCAKCHTPKLAGQSCLQCHNYHVGHFPPRK